MWCHIAAVLAMCALCLSQPLARQSDLFVAITDQNATTIELAGTLILNPYLWWEQPRTDMQIGPDRNITINSRGTALVDLTDISGDLLSPGVTSIVALSKTTVTLSKLVFFSDTTLTSSDSFLSYVAWIQTRDDASVVYTDCSFYASRGSDLSLLAASIRELGGILGPSPSNDVLTIIAAALGHVSFMNSTVRMMNSVQVSTAQGVEQALRDESVQHIMVDTALHMADWRRVVDLHRPVIIETLDHNLMWDVGDTLYTLCVGGNGSLNLKGGFTFVTPCAPRPPYYQPLFLSFIYANGSNEALGPGVVRSSGWTAVGPTNTSALQKGCRNCTSLVPLYSDRLDGSVQIERWHLDGALSPTCKGSDAYWRVTNITQTIEPKTRRNHILTYGLGISLPLVGVGVFGALGVVLYRIRRANAVKALELQQTDCQKLTAIASRVLGKETVVTGLLGTGSFANVYKALWNGKIVALKVTFPMDISDNDNEVLLGLSLTHPNIVKTMRSAHRKVAPKKPDAPMARWPSINVSSSPSTENPRPPPVRTCRENWIVTEFCDLGSVRQAYKRNKMSTGWQHILYTIRDVVSALQYMHDHNTMHGDLNTNNIMLQTDTRDPRGFVAKVADLGLAQSMISWQKAEKNTMSYGTVTHQPPELLVSGTLCKETDIYATGIIMYELYVGDTPYKSMTHGAIVQQVTRNQLRPEFPSETPEDYSKLAKDCWHEKPEKRPTLGEVQYRLDRLIKQFITRAERAVSL